MIVAPFDLRRSIALDRIIDEEDALDCAIAALTKHRRLLSPWLFDALTEMYRARTSLYRLRRAVEREAGL